ncbi:MAG: bifunctional (p)ppGpp synthetase/guanosine-3',5'-bis(diphosphate) 3'-pyrophosphohydrolase [Phycisphaerales bacterium]|nr:bifunctional (p)ppGpp synthetase/guanosine-3',5'-bis(diphosphate) 3'-pyrophosphohydrolase [Phycisphaerales bacterium]
MSHPWQKAASFAARSHRHQVRKDGQTPYFAHPCRVAITLLAVFRCTDGAVLTAALLHDTIEDTLADFDEIEAQFGRPIADLVGALTKNKGLREREREADYDRRLAAAGWRALIVKLADCYDNVSDAGDPQRRRSATAKARRALALAGPCSDRPEVARAAAALRGLLAGRTKKRRSRTGVDR